MRKFKVKGSESYPEMLTIMDELGDNNYRVLLEKSNGFGVESREEVLSKELFESCIRTNYLIEVQAL